MTEHDPLVRLRHMRDYARSAIAIAERGSRDTLDRDEMFAFALIHALSMIGEAAAGVPPDIRDAAPEVPWADVIGMRHRLIHGYDHTRYGIVWDTMTVDVPELLGRLEALIRRLEEMA